MQNGKIKKPNKTKQNTSKPYLPRLLKLKEVFCQKSVLCVCGVFNPHTLCSLRTSGAAVI